MLTIYQGDALTVLREMDSNSVDCVVTSPPYWQLRDYGVPGQLGLEPTLEGYLARIVEVFAEVRRVLKKRGTCWVNIGDLYAGGGNGGGGSFAKDGIRLAEPGSDKNRPARAGARLVSKGKRMPRGSGRWGGGAGLTATPTLKRKDLVGLAWRVAFALQADGWWLRTDIVWSKETPMPESTRDRPTRSHEYLFLLTKSARYHYDADAIKEPCAGWNNGKGRPVNPKCAGWKEGSGAHRTIEHAKPGGSYKGSVPGRSGGPGQERRSRKPRQNPSYASAMSGAVEMRNKRTVWSLAAAGFKGAHFATFPPKLVEPCVLAGCPAGGTVLDPFAGSGTTGQVALELGRRAVLIELNPEYLRLIERRMKGITPGFAFEK